MKPSQALRNAVTSDFERAERRRLQKRASEAKSRAARKQAKSDPRAIIRQMNAADCEPRMIIRWRPETSEEAIARGVPYEVLPAPQLERSGPTPCRMGFRGRGSQG